MVSPVSPVKFHHPGIVVTEMEKAVEFYSILLNMSVVKQGIVDPSSPIFDAITGLEQARFEVCLLRGDNFYIEMFQFMSSADPVGSTGQSASAAGIRHLAFQVADIEKTVEQLLALGGGSSGKYVKCPMAARRFTAGIPLAIFWNLQCRVQVSQVCKIL